MEMEFLFPNHWLENDGLDFPGGGLLVGGKVVTRCSEHVGQVTQFTQLTGSALARIIVPFTLDDRSRGE